MKVINHGKAIGYVYNFKTTYHNYNVLVDDVLKEEELFLNALEKYGQTLESLNNKAKGSFKAIIETHIAFLNDEVVKEETLNKIRANLSAGFAYSEVINKYINELTKTNNQYLKDRIDDLLEIKENIIKQMYDKQIKLKLKKPTILIVKMLSVSLVLNLPTEVKAVIAKTGSELSHSAILIKEKNVPFIISDKYDYADDEIVLVDTKNNKIETKDKVAININEENSDIDKLETIKNKKINLYLNVSTLKEINNLENSYYKGVGLLRSEHLFFNEEKLPSLNKQIIHYKKVLREFYNKEVIIRLFDFKKDKTNSFFISNHVKEFKFEGLLKEIYQEQLKALIIANEPFGNLKIIIPMIRSVNEYKRVLAYLNFLKEDLNLVRQIPKLGIMLETKEALNEIKKYFEVDFVNIGTNDLIKELYNIDRENSLDLAKFNDEIIETLTSATNFLIKNKIPYCFCGNIASTVEGLKKLLVNGENCFSIASGFLEEAVKTINNYYKK